ncbi:site-specific DNA-methyltransferase [Nocardioides yefusunii]|uniref:Methyltransferase n=1 Tax=Nocardioides yefusunii TaxID=2500546 RepID=A0ABW1QV64_9ACTN|nr:site-specific DNA-methyltransferase [Nocardioides yefusunii]
MTTWNTFVEGDNLDVLTAMPEASVDLVVTDPPYNTGNDFAYVDTFRGRDGRRAGRHEAWVAFMRPRLEQMHRVLAPTGALAISIDDNEQARLRLLLDDVFGEENFLAQVVVNLNSKGRQLGSGFATNHEYLLVYSRDAKQCVLDARTTDTVDPADFPHVTDDGRAHRFLPLRNTNKKFNPVSTPTLHYPLHGDPITGRVDVEPFEGSTAFLPVFGDGAAAVWRWSVKLAAERPHDLVCREIRGLKGPRADIFQRDWLDAPGGRRKKLRTIWHHEEIGSTDTSAAELKKLIGKVFESPKPTGLVRRVLRTMPDDARVLDPFAGSGTTGHAVAMLNVEDGGTRTCVSINVAEPTRAGSAAALAGLTTVADITRARLRAVAEEVGGGLVEQVFTRPDADLSDNLPADLPAQLLP